MSADGQDGPADPSDPSGRTGPAGPTAPTPGRTPAARVRVTGPERRPVRRSPARTREIDDDTPLGAIYMGSLLREQLRLALGVLALLALTVGSLPLVFHLFPGLAATRLLGIPLAWLVLGVGVYPLLVVLGWGYVRRAERNEAAFADLVSEAGPVTTPRGAPEQRR